MKDNFSTNSELYKQFRPSYPTALFPFILEQLSSFENAWDCGCGNGQLATHLATKFDAVYATDISQQQLDNAPKLTNIHYSLQAAEKTNFESNFFDLIVVGQAIHWFDFEAFYTEVCRTAKKDALLVVVGYGKLEINPEIDEVIEDLYSTILGEYWDKERRYIDERYQTIPFPFEEIICPVLENNYNWTIEQLIGYLNTWSAVKHYQQKNNNNPIHLIRRKLTQLRPNLTQLWNDGEQKLVNFPLLLRVGRINSNKN